MVIINHIPWVSYADLMAEVPADFEKSLSETIKKGTARYRKGGLTSWENQRLEGLVHIKYGSIPELTIAKYDLPSKEVLMANNLSAMVNHTPEAYDYYLTQPLVIEYATELADIFSWLLFLAGVKRSAAHKLGYNSVDGLYSDALSAMNAKGWEKWKSSDSLQMLKRRLKPFNRLFKSPLNGEYTKHDIVPALKEVMKIAKVGKVGNNNARKVGEEQEALLVQIYSESNKPNIEQAYFMYLKKAGDMIQAYHATNGEHGWDEKSLISLSTAKQILYRHEHTWHESRHGHQSYREKYEPVTKRIRPRMANALWVIDGSPIHRYYTDTKKKTAFARLNAFVVLDAHSWCVLGFCISDTEDSAAVISALRSACVLGKHLPHQIQSDNGKAIQSMVASKCMNVLTNKITPTIVGNARAKVIERFFAMFNEQVLKFRKGYTGNPINAKRQDNQPNREALTKQLKEFATVEQAIQQLHEDFALWNNRIMKKYGKSPLQMYRDSMGTTQGQQRAFTNTHMVEAFYTMPGEYKKLKVKEGGATKHLKQFIPEQYEYTNRGIGITINKEKRDFFIDLPAFNAQHIGTKFSVKYDHQQPDTIYLYKDGKPFVFDNAHMSIACKDEYHMALTDHQEGEMGKLRAHQDSKKVQRELSHQKLERFVAITKGNGTYTQAITNNAFDKEVLNGAKAQIMEKVMHGDDYSLEKAKEIPEASKVEKFADMPINEADVQKKNESTNQLKRWG